MRRKLGPKGQVVIPKTIRDALDLREGSSLEFHVSGQAIVVRPEPTPAQAVEEFLAMPGPRRRKRVDWKELLDEEYRVPR